MPAPLETIRFVLARVSCTVGCSFDQCELFNGIILGIISSALFTVLYYLIRKHWVYRRKYGRIAGDFAGYVYKDDNAGVLSDLPVSKATIRHLVETRLSITVSHGAHFENIWVGEITMQSQKYGIIVWQYVKPENMRHFFGFKKLIVEDDFNTLNIIGESTEGFGKEVLKRLSVGHR